MSKFDQDRPDEGLGLLLVQLGFRIAQGFGRALAPLGLEPRQFGVLSRLAANEGHSQQALGELLGLSPSRVVFLIDELEEAGLVERRPNKADRRSHALHLTVEGRRALTRARLTSKSHESSLGSSLNAKERAQLVVLLRRLAREQGIEEGSLPGPPPDHFPPQGR